jgi:kynurenine formamidase
MTVFPGDPEVVIAPALTVDDVGVNVLRVHIGSQSGTHVDAPFHILPDGEKLDELPLDRFVGPAVVVDARDVGPDASIEVAVIERVADRLEPGAIVLLHTGWARHFDDYTRYRAHPWLSVQAARALVDAGVRTVGIDALNVDATPENLERIRFDTHRVLLGAGGVIVENLRNLDAIEPLHDPVVSVLPLRIPRADGAPVRAVAYEP